MENGHPMTPLKLTNQVAYIFLVSSRQIYKTCFAHIEHIFFFSRFVLTKSELKVLNIQLGITALIITFSQCYSYTA